jgi:hypothetical protein
MLYKLKFHTENFWMLNLVVRLITARLCKVEFSRIHLCLDSSYLKNVNIYPENFCSTFAYYYYIFRQNSRD